MSTNYLILLLATDTRDWESQHIYAYASDNLPECAYVIRNGYGSWWHHQLSEYVIIRKNKNLPANFMANRMYQNAIFSGENEQDALLRTHLPYKWRKIYRQYKEQLAWQEYRSGI